MTTDTAVTIAVITAWVLTLIAWALVAIVVGPRVVAWHRRGVARVQAAERRRHIADRAFARHARPELTDKQAEQLWEYLLTDNGVTRVPAPRKRRTR